jgi:hypothetical protein
MEATNSNPIMLLAACESTAEPLVQLARVKCRLLERIHKSGTETQLSSHSHKKQFNYVGSSQTKSQDELYTLP